MPTTAYSRELLFPGAYRQEKAMAAAIIENNGRIRIEFSPRWYMRLLSLPVLAASLCFLVVSGAILRQDLFGGGYWREDFVGLAMCLVFALIIGLPGLVLATGRYFVDLDRILQQAVVIRKYGPVKFENLRKLAEFKFLSITDRTYTDKDGDITSRSYSVNLCGGKAWRRSTSARSTSVRRPPASPVKSAPR